MKEPASAEGKSDDSYTYWRQQKDGGKPLPEGTFEAVERTRHAEGRTNVIYKMSARNESPQRHLRRSRLKGNKKGLEERKKISKQEQEQPTVRARDQT